MRTIKIFLILVFTFIGFVRAQNHYIVNKITNIGQAGELLFEINKANAHIGLDYIDFAFQGLPLPIEINMANVRIDITDPIVIDGNTQTGTLVGDKKIVIVSAATIAITIEYQIQQTQQCEIKNIRLVSDFVALGTFAFEAMDIIFANKVLIKDCIFHTSLAFANSGYSGTGLFIAGANDIKIFGNTFGKNPALPNTDNLAFQSAITFTSGASNNFPNNINNTVGGVNANLGETPNYFYNSKYKSNQNLSDSIADIFGFEGTNIKISGNLFINSKRSIADLGLAANVNFNNHKLKPVFTNSSSNGFQTTFNGTTSASNDFIEVFLTNDGGIDALEYLGRVQAVAGIWSLTVLGTKYGQKFIATATDVSNNTSVFSNTYLVPIPPLPCTSCVGTFLPEVGKDYVLSAWVKEGGPNTIPSTLVTYGNAKISIEFAGAATLGPYTASGDIIDGWQRIEKQFTIPTTATDIKIKLESASGDSYFDDIRIHPKDGSMKSYVYDPITLRLSAELDERNYATFYEYDEEGKLIRVKKETERGVMTIKENRNNTKK
jgi:hypothetical protein